MYDYFHTSTPTYTSTSYYYCTSPCSGYYNYDGYYYWCPQPCSYSSYPSTFPSLAASCSASPNPAQVNQNVNFTAYPSGGSGVYSYSWSGNCSSGSAACSRSFSSAGTYTATVTVTSGSQSTSTSCSVNVQGSSNPNLSINKLVRNLTDGTGWQDLVSADPLDRLEFSIQVTSTGSGIASNVIVTDVLPSQISYQGNLRVDGGYSGGDITSGINLGSFSAGQSKTITFEARISSEGDFSYGTTTLINYGRVSADNVSQIGDTALVNVYRLYIPHSPGLTITKLVKNNTDNTGWVDSLSADPSDSLSFSLQINSNGTTTADNVQVKDILPSQIIYQGNLKIDSYYSSGDIINGFNLGSLSVGQSKTITFDARVADTSTFALGTTNLINIARTWADGITYVQDTAIVNVYRFYTSSSYGLTIDKLVRNVTDNTGWQTSVSADPSDLLSFSIQITSNGSTTANNVWVRDTLPSRIYYQGNLKIDGYSSSGDIINGFNLGSLNVGQTKTLIFDARVGSETEFSYGTNTLINYIRTWADNVSQVEDTATVYVYRTSVAGVSTGAFSINNLVRNLSDGTAWLETVSSDPGEVLTLSIQVTASGSSLYNVIVKDTLPSQITYQGNLKVDNVSTTGDIISGLNIGNLYSGQTKTVTFDARVASTDQFTFGTTELISTVLAYTTTASLTDTVKVNVTKAAVAGAVTGVVTGVNVLYFSLIIALLLSLGVFFLSPRLENSRFVSKIRMLMFR